MTISELIKFLEDLNEPDLPVIIQVADSERAFLQARWISIIDDDYTHAEDENGRYVPVGRGLFL